MDDLYFVNSRTFDGEIKRTWRCELIDRSESLYLLRGVFEQEVLHPSLGRIAAGTVSYEFFWTDRWYNIFRFHEPDGSFRNFYCNICRPAEVTGRAIDYIDLDIDLVVDRKGGFVVLDEIEFQENSVRYSYPPEVVHEVRSAVESLLALIEGRKFPFDHLDKFQQPGGDFVLPSTDPKI